MTVPTHIVSSVKEFEAIFVPSAASATPPADAFLLCYEMPADASVTPESLANFETCVQTHAAKFNTRLNLYLWDCSSRAFAAAKAQLNKVSGEPLLLIVYRGAIADTVRGPSLQAMMSVDVPRVCERLASFQAGAKPASVSQTTTSTGSGSDDKAGSSPGVATRTTTVRVDVAKMVGLGRKLLTEAQPFYAEKFFVKALNALDAVADEVYSTSDEDSVRDYEGSVAMCLAWAAFSQFVQAKNIQDNVYMARLTGNDTYAPFRTEPLSDAMRVCATQQLLLAVPGTWRSDVCSQKALGEKLASNPRDDDSRSLLIVTLFFSGDMERCLTEAVKLYALEVPFGRVALKNIAAFLGEDHPLVERLGPLRPTTKPGSGENATLVAETTPSTQ